MAAMGRLAWVFGRLTVPTAVARVQALISLLPPGKFWRLDQDSKTHKLLAGIADELERVRARYTQLMEERDPRTATETLDEWEASLSLPDDVVPVLPTSAASRRQVIIQKFLASGGQDLAFFTALCSQCGYPLVSIDPGGLMLRAKFRCGARCFAEAWGYTCTITLGPSGPAALTHAQVESVLRTALHAHLNLLVLYT